VLLEDKLRSQGFEVVTICADDQEHKSAAEKFIQIFRVQGPVYLKQADNDDHFINAIDPKWSGALSRARGRHRRGQACRRLCGAPAGPAARGAFSCPRQSPDRGVRERRRSKE
jgi:hypothetical protein